MHITWYHLYFMFFNKINQFNMKKTCKICDRLVPSIEDEFCCAGCSAVFSIIEKLNLEGSERDERIKMLLEGVFGGTDVDVCSEDIENAEKTLE